MLVRLVDDFRDGLSNQSCRWVTPGRLTLLIIPTVVFVTLTVLTLALCARRMLALVDGENLTGSATGVELRMYRSAVEFIIFWDQLENDKIP